MMSTLSIEKLIENETEISKCKEDITNRLRAINAKINTNNEFKDELTLIKNKILKQANDHMRAEFNRILMVKINEIKNDLESYMVNLEKNLAESNERGNLLRTKLEEELKSYLEIINQSKNSPSHQQKNRSSYNKEDDFFDYDDDALMINESINEFSETNTTTTTNNRTNDLQRVFTNINQIKQNIENFLQENHSNKLAFKECLLNVDDVCLGHITSEDLITHESFQLDTSLIDNLTYEVDRECLIRFSCPSSPESLSSDEPDKFKNNLKIDLYDSTQMSVPIVLKERIDSNRRRNFQVYFKPNKPGIFKLIIKYKSTNVLKSPLYFVVLSTSKTTQPLTSSSLSSTDKLKDLNDANAKLKNFHINIDCDSTENEKKTSKSESKANDSDSFDKAFSYAISVGRGRLLRAKDKAKEQAQMLQNVSSPFNILSQKRKSPSYTTDLNNNQMVDISIEDESIMPKESSSKLQRANAMDTDQLNSYFDSSNLQAMSPDICLLSNHVKKYSKFINGRLLKEEIPSLKAQFVQKFSEGLNFPIGVRACVKRNFLFVCNSSAHEIKIFHRINASEVYTIKSNQTQYTFLRPSALVIKNNELFIKDDKEIIVFDLDDNFKFLRKFGAKILQKPYGLAFNPQENLVVVDANLKEPKMHVFNAKTGELLNSSQYEPVVPHYARSSVLNLLYYGNKADLPPMDKTKIRFIDSSHDHVYAADLGRSIIFKTTYEGQIVKAFGTFGKRSSQFYEPSGIHVDSDGKALIIGDSKNNRIQLYDSEGDYKCDIEFLNEKIVRPSDIHVDSEGYLYVSCFIQHCIKKFKLIEQ